MNGVEINTYYTMFQKCKLQCATLKQEIESLRQENEKLLQAAYGAQTASIIARYLPDHITLVGFHGDRDKAAKYLCDKIKESLNVKNLQ